MSRDSSRKNPKGARIKSPKRNFSQIPSGAPTPSRHPYALCVKLPVGGPFVYLQLPPGETFRKRQPIPVGNGAPGSSRSRLQAKRIKLPYSDTAETRFVTSCVTAERNTWRPSLLPARKQKHAVHRICCGICCEKHAVRSLGPTTSAVHRNVPMLPWSVRRFVILDE